MSTKHLSRFTSAALVTALVVANSSPARAQAGLAGIGQGRTTDERVVTQAPTPPPVNSAELRAAEGQLPPGVPAANRTIDPARREMGVAFLIQHALGMAIEGSSLRTIARQSAGAGVDPSIGKALLDQANRDVIESERLLGQAAADGPGLASNPTIRRFHSAANAYIATLVDLEKAGPAEKAQVALINHAVKEALDANHILRMGPVAGGSRAFEQLVQHAGSMKTEGTRVVNQLAGNGPLEPSSATSVASLAVRGREVIDASAQIAPGSTSAANVPANPLGGFSPATNPGRFQDDRPQIIGGTYGTGSPSTGTVRTVPPFSKEALSKINRDGSPIPTPPNGDTNGSTGGSSPRQ